MHKQNPPIHTGKINFIASLINFLMLSAGGFRISRTHNNTYRMFRFFWHTELIKDACDIDYAKETKSFTSVAHGSFKKL